MQTGSRWQQSLFFICLLNSTSSVVFLLTQRSGGLGPLQLEPCAWLGASFGTLVSFDLVYGHEYHSIRYALFGYRVGQQNIAMWGLTAPLLRFWSRFGLNIMCDGFWNLCRIALQMRQNIILRSCESCAFTPQTHRRTDTQTRQTMNRCASCSYSFLFSGSGRVGDGGLGLQPVALSPVWPSPFRARLQMCQRLCRWSKKWSKRMQKGFSWKIQKMSLSPYCRDVLP